MMRYNTGNLIVSCQKDWCERTLSGYRMSVLGDELSAESYERAGALLGEASRFPNDVVECLMEGSGFRSVIASNGRYCFASVDHCRSYPVFFANKNKRLFLSDSCRQIQRELKQDIQKPSADILLEAAMSGYVTGDNTLDPDVLQLRAGEYLIWDHEKCELKRGFHFRYEPEECSKTFGEFVDEFHHVSDQCFQTVIKKANGRKILVPLSGGLDSRFVLSKLHSLGYDNISAFSYGPKANSDARAAKHIARTLNVPWQFVPLQKKDYQKHFLSEIRKSYWAFADGYCSVPNNQDMVPLIKMRQLGVLSQESLIVNGQTGDFISGGHIPLKLAGDDVKVNALYEEIISKHYGLWKKLFTQDNKELIKDRINKALGIEHATLLGKERAIALFERWEYEERQAKYIVNGQRIYEYLKLDWALPLWDRAFVSYWRRVPVDLKINQTLYKTALKMWNYKGVFQKNLPKVTAWSPMATACILPVSIGMRFLIGRRKRDKLMRYARYIDRFGHHYGAFGFKTFMKHSDDIRNPVSLYMRAWLSENGLWDQVK